MASLADHLLLNIRLFIHKLRIALWLLLPSKTSIDFCGESFLSLSARWHGESDPLITYMNLIGVLRNCSFSGPMLEIGGGYSTILLNHYLHSEITTLTSIDAYPQKYLRILNGRAASRSFLATINSIQTLSVDLYQAKSGLSALLESLSLFTDDDILPALSQYTSDISHAQQILSMLRSNQLYAYILSHDSVSIELPFYQKSKGANSFVSSNVLSNHKESPSYNAIFFDSGEFSGAAEWTYLSDLIPIGGYALLHDIYYPKSIKNFLVATFIHLSSDWTILWKDSFTAQGGLVAKRVSRK